MTEGENEKRFHEGKKLFKWKLRTGRGEVRGVGKPAFPQRVRTVIAVAKRQLLIKCLLFLFSF